jgi:hypothetical protein
MLHAHISQSSRDCDGDYSSGYLVSITDAEMAGAFPDLVFKERILVHVARFHSVAELRVSPLGLEWYEDTEEGFNRTSVTWCEDDCTIPAPWQRDHRAEAAGY